MVPAAIIDLYAVSEACTVFGDSVYMSFILSVVTPTKHILP